jgi:hypothetical protein
LFEYHMASPLWGVARWTTFWGRFTRMPSAVLLGVREVWPTLTSRAEEPTPKVSGSTQPSTYLSHRPMWTGMAWNSGPVCDPEDIRSQKSTSDSATPLVSYRSGRPGRGRTRGR